MDGLFIPLEQLTAEQMCRYLLQEVEALRAQITSTQSEETQLMADLNQLVIQMIQDVRNQFGQISAGLQARIDQLNGQDTLNKATIQQLTDELQTYKTQADTATATIEQFSRELQADDAPAPEQPAPGDTTLPMPTDPNAPAPAPSPEQPAPMPGDTTVPAPDQPAQPAPGDATAPVDPNAPTPEVPLEPVPAPDGTTTPADTTQPADPNLPNAGTAYQA